MNSVRTILVSLSVAGSLLTAAASPAAAGLSPRGRPSLSPAAEHVRLEMRMLRMQIQWGCSPGHPEVVSLRREIGRMAHRESPRVASRVRRGVAHQLRGDQAALQAEYRSRQATMTEQHPLMVQMRSEIALLRHIRRQYRRA